MDAADAMRDVEVALRALRGVVDEPEPIDELDHALQAAGLALAAAADDELVAATLLHDIGRSPALGDTTGEHDRVAQGWLAPRLGARVAWLAGAHVAAKIYLVATDPAYGSLLTPASVESLAAQRDAGPAPHLDDRSSDPRWPDALRLRRWDDRAKIPGAPAPSVADVLTVVGRVAEQAAARDRP